MHVEPLASQCSWENAESDVCLCPSEFKVTFSDLQTDEICMHHALVILREHESFDFLSIELIRP